MALASTMHLRFAKSLCTSTLLHGAALAAAVGVWALPAAFARGKERPRDVFLQVAEVARPEAAPPPMREELLPLEEPEVEDVPETLELLPPPRPIEDTRFDRPDLQGGPPLDRPFHHPRPTPPEAAPAEVEPTPPAEEVAPAPTPEVDVAAGEPDPLVLRPVATHNPKPRYPRRAVERGIEGVVLLRLVVDATGAVVSAEVTESSGSALLDRAALGAVKGWRFEPGRRDGEAVEMELPWKLDFNLDA